LRGLFLRVGTGRKGRRVSLGYVRGLGGKELGEEEGKDGKGNGRE